MATWTISKTLGLFCALALITGCGGEFKTVPVSGTVTLDNVPVASAGVMFLPQQAGPPAYATTDANGKFTLNTGRYPGAAPGKYRITVNKETASGVPSGPDELESSSRTLTVKQAIPASYADHETTRLEMTIDAARSDADLKLSSK